MSIRVAINGFGRIGRNILRAKYENSNFNDIQVVAINDLGDSNVNAHLLVHDTVHGKFQKPVAVEDDKIIIDNSDEILVLLSETQRIFLGQNLRLMLFLSVQAYLYQKIKQEGI